MNRSMPWLLAATLIAPAHADSLFPGSGANTPGSVAGVSLFADNKAHLVGDILTIVINETASAASQAATKTSKTESMNYGPGTGPTLLNFGPLHFGLGSIPALGLSGGTGSDASGSTSRTDNLAARITVTVTQVLPGGNLQVQGHRLVGMNAETQDITLTGVVRPQDIAADNTVQSPLLADAQIKYGGKGPVGDKQHAGLISRIFKLLF